MSVYVYIHIGLLYRSPASPGSSGAYRSLKYGLHKDQAALGVPSAKADLEKRSAMALHRLLLTTAWGGKKPSLFSSPASHSSSGLPNALRQPGLIVSPR